MVDSKRQSNEARSTPEAEAIAMASAMFGEALNIQVLLKHLLGHAVDVVFHQDDEAQLDVLLSGYSAKVHHCNRVHRINIASMSGQLAEPHISASYCKSEDQIANDFTKIIAPAEWPRTLEQFGLQASGAGPHPDAVCTAIDVTLPAEILASEFPKIPTAQDLVAVHRGSSHVFAAGAFVKGGVYGLRRGTTKFRQTVSAICRFFNHYLPSHTYTSVILQQCVVISFHKDSHNEEGSCNLLVSVIPAHGPILYGLRTSKVAQGACACHWRQLPLASMFDNPRRSSRRSMVAFDSSLLVILYQAAFLQDLLHLSR